VFSDPEFVTNNELNLTRDQLYTESIRKHVLIWKRLKELKTSDLFDKNVFIQAALGPEPSGLMLHELAFLPMITSQASEEQLQKWSPLLDSYQMIGCYAQTELGHGTFVRGLETTATYDPLTKTFVLNSPTLTSTKWWIGSLGLSANHAVLLAQLYTGGQCHGVHAFLVQIRDIDTHKPLPGITVGDIGPKLGLNAVDNGFLRLNNVRIPRENMLMKHSKVLEDGTFIKPPNEKLVYGGMLGIRALIPVNTAATLAAAVTIAIRYSCVRRQSELKPNAPEAQVLDFQTQQHKLFPWLAAVFAYRLTGFAMVEMFLTVTAECREGKYERLIEVHGLSAGLKAVVATRAIRGIEQCRLSCGGHGYSLASGLPLLYGFASTVATAEGEATILLLQTARYLIKNCLQASRGNRVDAFMTYLLPNNNPSSFDGRTNLDSLVHAYAFIASRTVTKTANRLQRVMSESGLTQELAWNECLVDLANAAVVHIDYVLVRLFAEKVTNYQSDASVKRILEALCKLYAIHGLIENAGVLVEEHYLTSADLDNLSSTLYSLYSTIRPDALSIVDAFDFHDQKLRSAIGCYDGQVYEKLYEWASHSALNSTDVHESFHKYLKPLRSQAKL
jgi:acyl-CoA oxidase